MFDNKFRKGHYIYLYFPEEHVFKATKLWTSAPCFRFCWSVGVARGSGNCALKPIYINIYIYAYMNIYTTYVYMYVCMYICIYTYIIGICICIYIYTHHVYICLITPKPLCRYGSKCKAFSRTFSRTANGLFFVCIDMHPHSYKTPRTSTMVSGGCN